MAHKIIVKDTVTGQCGLADPLAQPTVVAGTGGGTVIAGGTPAAPNYTVNFPAGVATPVFSAAVCNGLTQNPDGLWYPERTKTAADTTSTLALGTGPTTWAAATTPTTPLIEQTFPITITNPSTCRDADVYLDIQTAVGVIGAGATTCILSTRGELFEGATLLGAVTSDNVPNGDVTNLTAWGRVNRRKAVIPAGTSKTFNYRVLVNASAPGVATFVTGFGSVNWLLITR